MRYEKSDEPIVAMKVGPMTHRTCAAGYIQGATMRGQNPTQQRGSRFGKSRGEQQDNINPIKKKSTRKVSTVEFAVKRYLAEVCEDDGITAGNQDRWRQK